MFSQVFESESLAVFGEREQRGEKCRVEVDIVADFPVVARRRGGAVG